MSSNKEPTFFQAIAAYDICRSRDKSENPFEGDMLIFDFDVWGVGLCRCLPKGKIKETAQTMLENTKPVSEIYLQERLSLEDILNGRAETDLNAVNRALKNLFRTNGAVDKKIPLGNTEIKCSEINNAFSETCGSYMDRLFDAADGIMKENNVDVNNIRIVLSGALAKFYAVEFMVRKEFSENPFLKDDRFAQTEQNENPAEFYRIGRKLYSENKVEFEPCIGHRVEVLFEQYVPERDFLQSEKLTLSNPEQGVSDFDKARYFGSIYISLSDKLLLSVDGEENNIELPTALQNGTQNYINVEAAVIVENLNIFLALRNSLNGRTANVPLNIAVKEG